MSIGVISHLPNPDFAAVRRLAEAAEAAGADWLGLPDAFWWRDTWLLLAEASRATQKLNVGPLVTNPYLRHPFQTISALASLQDLAGERVFVGLGAGGSEVSGAAGISRRDAPDRLRALIALLTQVADGQPLDAASGRRLDIPLKPVRVVVARRGDRILRMAGECADAALLWAIPSSDLDRSASLVTAFGRSTELIWAPLVDHGGASRERLRAIAAYSVLNSSSSLQARWGLSRAALATIRGALVSGGAASAQQLVPPAALDDLILPDPTPIVVARQAVSLRVTSIAVPAFTADEVAARVAWARAVSTEAQRL